MPLTLRGTVRFVSSQFVPNRQYNFYYSDLFRKLSMPAVNSGSFLTFIYVFMKLLVANGLLISFY